MRELSPEWFTHVAGQLVLAVSWELRWGLSLGAWIPLHILVSPWPTHSVMTVFQGQTSRERIRWQMIAFYDVFSEVT